MKAFDSHRIGLKALLNDVAVGVVELTTQIGPSQSSEITHPIDEKLRVGDAVFLFQLSEKLFSGIAAPVPGTSCVEYDFRINVNCGGEPRLLFSFELNLFLIDSDVSWFSGEALIVVLGVCLVPVMNRGSASFDAEPLAEVSTLG